MVVIQLDINDFRLKAPIANVVKERLHSLQVLTRDQSVCCHGCVLHTECNFIY